MKNRVNWLQSLLAWLDPRQLLLLAFWGLVILGDYIIWALVEKRVTLRKQKKTRDVPS